MAKVYVKKNDSRTSEEAAVNFETALRLFKRKTNDEKLLWELKRREAYMKPGVKKRRKRELAAIARHKKVKKVSPND